jgi:hypothetical protein
MSKNDKDDADAARLRAIKTAKIEMSFNKMEVVDEEYVPDDTDEVPPDDQSICPNARFPAMARELVKVDSRYMFASRKDMDQADTNVWAAARHDLASMREVLSKTSVAPMIDEVLAQIDAILADRPAEMQKIAREWEGMSTVTVKVAPPPQSH